MRRGPVPPHPHPAHNIIGDHHMLQKTPRKHARVLSLQIIMTTLDISLIFRTAPINRIMLPNPQMNIPALLIMLQHLEHLPNTLNYLFPSLPTNLTQLSGFGSYRKLDQPLQRRSRRPQVPGLGIRVGVPGFKFWNVRCGGRRWGGRMEGEGVRFEGSGIGL